MLSLYKFVPRLEKQPLRIELDLITPILPSVLHPKFPSFPLDRNPILRTRPHPGGSSALPSLCFSRSRRTRNRTAPFAIRANT